MTNTRRHLRSVDAIHTERTAPTNTTGPTRTTYTRRDARRMARTYRRMYRGTRPSLVARIAGWIMLGVSVATISGLGAVMVGGHLDGIERNPTPTYEYRWSLECPTEDSCDRYGNPIVP